MNRISVKNTLAFTITNCIEIDGMRNFMRLHLCEYKWIFIHIERIGE